MSDPQNPVRVLSADDILAVEDITIVPVDVPEWGGMVYVKAMTALEREKYLSAVRKVVGKGRNAHEVVEHERSSALLAAMTVVDAQGNRLFTKEHIEALSRKSSAAMQRILNAAGKLNGFDDDKDDDRKNGSAAPTAADDALSTD